MREIEVTEPIVGELRRFLAASQILLAGGLQPPPETLVHACACLREKLAREIQSQARVVLSLHIPKTAGLTFSRLLAEVFREDFYRSYWEVTNCRGERVEDFPTTTRCVHGHVNLDRMLERFPSAALVTWVREPVQRLASFYQYWIREPDWRHPLCRDLHERRLSLVEFARCDQMRNEMTRYFGHCLPADFSFIGLFEELPASIGLFLRKFALPPMAVAHTNRNPTRAVEGYPLSEDDRAEIAALNEADCALYRECVARFRRECQETQTEPVPPDAPATQ